MNKHLLHWSPRSPFVKKVEIALSELGLSDQVERVRSVVPTDDFEHPIFADNPLGRIPTLVTPDGEKLQDSTVVIEYIDYWIAKAEPDSSLRLFPGDPLERVRVRHIEMLCNGAMEVLVSWIIEWYLPTARATANYRIFRYKVENVLDALNAHVIAFELTPTRVDSISMGALLAYLEFRFNRIIEWRDGRSELSTWYESFSRRPSLANNPFTEG